MDKHGNISLKVLDGHDFSFWHFQMKIILNAKKMMKIVDILEPQLTKKKDVWD
jgi:hypothetical protein